MMQSSSLAIPAHNEPRQDQVNVLVVDDQPDKLIALEAALSSLGENIVTARSGREALRRLLEQDFAVILLDVNMPDMDGFETAAMIRQHRRCAHTPIIFVTAFGDDMHTAQGYSLGAVDYILSPVVPDILRTKVSVFAELFRKSQEISRHAEQRIALAQEQAARESAEEMTRRSNFLAEATAVMTRSLDPRETLRGINQTVVPFLADFSALVLVEDKGGEAAVDAVGIDAEGQRFAIAHSSLDEFSSDLADTIRRAIDAGILITLPLSASKEAGDPEGFGAEALCCGLNMHAVAIVPLSARSQAIGALVLGLHQPGRSFGPPQLELAEDLAGRAGIAIDNARLHESIKEHDRRKDEFLAMLGHELRNPLGPVRNAVQILRLTGPSDATSEQAREMIERQVGHMTRLIDDLLDVSRIARGKIQLQREHCDLTRLVRQTAEDHRPAIENSGLELSLNVPEQPLWVLGDSTRMSQIVGNLLHNAHKFTDAGGAIDVRISADPEKGFALLTVRDSGIGMEPETLSNIFIAFSQADRSLDRSRGGLGLGLALVKGLVELHGGSVGVASLGLGRGSEFSVQLPLEMAPSQLLPAEPSLEVHNAAYRILVIEDNRDGAESMRMLLSLMGHQPAVAHTGPSGLELARRSNPHVILCDIGLPGMDGYAVARCVRSEPALAEIKLIALTGYGQEEDQRRAREAGFDRHLTKPVNIQDLTIALSSLPMDRSRPPSALASSIAGGSW